MTKRRLLTVYLASFAAVAVFAGAASAAMGKIEGFSFTGTAGKDLAGAGSAIAADGNPDAEFSVRIKGSGAISGFTLKNLTTGQEWSTGSGNVLVVTDSKGSAVNSSFPAVAFVLGAEYRLYVNDRAALTASGGEFELSVKFIDSSAAAAKVQVAAQPVSADAGAAAPQNVQQASSPGTAGAAAATGNASVISASYKGVGGYDLSDGTKKINSNMNPDHRFDISLAGKDTLTGVRVRSLGGGAPERTWDTVPTTQNPLVAVTELNKGTPLNKADGSVSIPVNDLLDLSLWVDGNEDMKKQDFRLTFLFTGGRIIETDIKQAAPAASAQQPRQGQQPARPNARRSARSVELKAKPTQIKLDVVGKNRQKKASGARDFSMVIAVRGEGSIEAVSLANQTGKGRWDTNAGSSAWLMIVRKNNNQTNNPKDFTVSIPVRGTDTLELLLEDDGGLAKKDARFLLAVTWDDGEITEQLMTW
ncbi:MAG: hypothetical protein LBR87_03415 [Synergistaceae bacterium]|jgi:hypothetical protein|nr:hypothetical protein [Synergistaceae bacterium]